MLRIILLRPGSTQFDNQGRIKGTLSIPLNDQGIEQAAATARELVGKNIEVVYSSPCQSAYETAVALAYSNKVKIKRVERLQNLNQGLWQGKLINDVRQQQPKVYRRWQDNPDTICPPEGEMIGTARKRVESAISKILKRHKNGVIVVVAPEPLASLIRCFLCKSQLGDLWKAECVCGRWESIDVKPEEVVLNH